MPLVIFFTLKITFSGIGINIATPAFLKNSIWMICIFNPFKFQPSYIILTFMHFLKFFWLVIGEILKVVLPIKSLWFCGIGFGNDFLVLTPKSHGTKEKIDKFIKV